MSITFINRNKIDISPLCRCRGNMYRIRRANLLRWKLFEQLRRSRRDPTVNGVMLIESIVNKLCIIIISIRAVNGSNY